MFVDDPSDLPKDGGDRPIRVDFGEESTRAVKPDERFGLGFVNAESVDDGLFVVIAAVTQESAAVVALVIETGGRGIAVVNRSTLGASQTSGQALDEVFGIHLEQDGDREGPVQGLEKLLQCLGLFQIPRKAVKQEPGSGIGLNQPVADDAHHNGVGDEQALIHDRLGLEPQG